MVALLACDVVGKGEHQGGVHTTDPRRHPEACLTASSMKPALLAIDERKSCRLLEPTKLHSLWRMESFVSSRYLGMPGQLAARLAVQLAVQLGLLSSDLLSINNFPCVHLHLSGGDAITTHTRLQQALKDLSSTSTLI